MPECVGSVEEGYCAQKSFTFYITYADGGSGDFTLYAYDWSEAIYVMGSQAVFESV